MCAKRACRGKFLAIGEGGPEVIFRPGDGEGMRRPERVAWEIGVDVTTGRKAPGAREVEGDAAGLGWEGLDGHTGESVLASPVAVDDSCDAEDVFEHPKSDCDFHVFQLRKLAEIAVYPDSCDGDSSCDFVDVEECLVKLRGIESIICREESQDIFISTYRMAEWRPSLDAHENEHKSRDDTPQHEIRFRHGLLHRFEP